MLFDSKPAEATVNIRKTLLVITSATFISLSFATLAATSHDTDNRPFIRLSEEGSKAARNISMARVAIFDGQSQEAMKLVDQAKATLATAAQDVDKLAIKKPDKADSGPMIPIDAKLTMADDFTLTPERRKDLDKINEHLKKGETKEALNLLRPADVRLTLTTLFMPIDTTAKAVDQAAKLLAESKYYEANLALKKAEDGWVIDSQSFTDYLAGLPSNDKKAVAANTPNTDKPEASKPEK